jgi:hypothetical protein
MNDVTLNLIAITIFGITMGTLLGPVLGIPPEVPALATFGMLVMATVDRFAWQGLGGTLLVDWFAQKDPKHRDRLVYHEAGHFLVAYFLGVPVTGYALSAWDALRQGVPGIAGVRFEDRVLDTLLAQGRITPLLVDRYCQVWMAGGAAENLMLGNVIGGVDDVGKVRALLQQIKLPPRELEQKERWAALQAQELITRNKDAYESLVQAMKDRASIEDCIQSLQLQKV